MGSQEARYESLRYCVCKALGVSSTRGVAVSYLSKYFSREKFLFLDLGSFRHSVIDRFPRLASRVEVISGLLLCSGEKAVKLIGKMFAVG